MKRTSMYLLFLGFCVIMPFFYCNTLKNPYLNPDNVILDLVLKDSHGHISTDVSVTDSVGNAVYAGFTLNLPDLVDSVTMTMKKYVNNNDSVFVFRKIGAYPDTQGCEFTFTKCGGWIVTAVAYVREGETHKIIGDVSIVPKVPIAVISPVAQTGPIGGTRRFSVTAQGDAPFSYQWFHGTTVIPGDTNETLLRRALSYADSGSYSCVVRDKWGDTAVTVLSFLTVRATTISVDIAPSTVTGKVDSTIIFTVTATGDTPFTFQWHHDSSALAGKTDTLLSLGSLVLNDSGKYTCRVVNKWGDTVLSAPGVLHVVPNRILLESIKNIAVVSRKNGVVAITWHKTSDADSFLIFRSKDTMGFSIFKSVADTFFTDSIKDTVFYYYVVASSSKGESVPTNRIFSGSVNSAPLWAHDTIKVEVSEAALCSLYLADSVSDENGDKIGLRLSSGAPGSDTLVGSVWTCAPSYADSGSYSIHISASDGIAATPSVLTIMVRVKNVNRPPIPQRQDSVTAINSAPNTITLTAIDPDNDPIIKWRIVKPPVNGTLTLADSLVASVEYASKAGFVGLDSFSFDAFDGLDWSRAPATVIITVDSIKVPPQVTMEPRPDTAVFPDATISFSVEINRAYPAPSFAWYKGTIGDGIKIDSGRTLKIVTATVSDSGRYYVVVSNSAGSDTSAYAHVRVYIPPHIIAQPWADTTVGIGTSLTFFAGINAADPTPAFGWYKGTKGAAQKIDSVQTMIRQIDAISDSGTYFAVVLNSAGSDTSAYAHLSVVRLPVITQQPIDQTICMGQPDTFFVTAIGAALSYQWNLNGTPLSLATSRMLTFSTVTRAESGTYSCAISNKFGTVYSQTAKLTVNTLSVAPSSVTAASSSICRGTSTILTVVGGALGSGASAWKWFTGSCGGVFIGTGASISSGELNATTKFFVSAQGTCNTTCDSVTVTVGPPVSVIVGPSPTNQTKYSGGSAIFTIAAAGTEPLQYHWQKAGAAVGGSFPTCTLYNVSRSDSGAAITCTVSNACNPKGVTSGVATLTVISLVKVATGGNSTLVLAGDSTAWGFGDNSHGQLGDGSTTQRTTPVQVMKAAGQPLTRIIDLAAGGGHSIFLLSDGTVWSCGSNTYGQLGDGTNTDRLYAVLVPSLTRVTMIAAGNEHSIFLGGTTAASAPYVCGNNDRGQLGLGALANTTIPTLLPIGPQMHVYGICAGEFHTMVANYNTTYDLARFGLNTLGQLGDGTITNRTTPVVLIQSDPQSIAAGYGHSMMVTQDGKLFLWGDNSYGQLGDDIASQLSPYSLTKISDPRSAAAGSNHSLVLTATGTLWGFGRNNWGQLCIHTTTDQTYPVHISNDVKSMGGGIGHTAYVKTDGTLWTSGHNNAGQLGAGNTADRYQAARVKF
jgi:alpha-tubulin suppressor-like RCC1 family protein